MQIPYIDMHCDTLMQAWLHHKKDIFDMPKSMADISRLRTGGCEAQFFAVFMPPIGMKKYLGPFFPRDDTYINKLCGIFQNTVECHKDVIAPAYSFGQLEDNAKAGKLSAVLTLEDGRGINGCMDNLERYHKMGVRLISLTWNYKNCFGSPNSPDAAVMQQGLTAFGKDAVRRMNELNILVDVSHLSDGGFWDVVDLVTKPFVASHSNCRELNPHPRSLTDEMLRALAEKGGVAGVNFGPHFLSMDTSCEDSTVDLIAKHLRHMVDVGGADCAAIGTDFDGVKGNLEVGTPDRMPLLFEGLHRNGFTSGEIEKIASLNVRRVMREVMP